MPVIPHQGTVPFISGDTMNRLLTGGYGDAFKHTFVVDCRFAYEFCGGHIAGAINVTDPAMLKEQFFSRILPNAAIVFHCEFSQSRGPEMASVFRRIDRKLNESSYPKLHYPHVYVLQRGFSDFSRAYPGQIEGTYVRMLDPNARVSGALATAHAAFKRNCARAHAEFEMTGVDICTVHSPLSPALKRRRVSSA
jgi:M-phase inducer tyrosine phosphatase